MERIGLKKMRKILHIPNFRFENDVNWLCHIHRSTLSPNAKEYMQHIVKFLHPCSLNFPRQMKWEQNSSKNNIERPGQQPIQVHNTGHFQELYSNIVQSDGDTQGWLSTMVITMFSSLGGATAMAHNILDCMLQTTNFYWGFFPNQLTGLKTSLEQSSRHWTALTKDYHSEPVR